MLHTGWIEPTKEEGAWKRRSLPIELHRQVVSCKTPASPRKNRGTTRPPAQDDRSWTCISHDLTKVLTSSCNPLNHQRIHERTSRVAAWSSVIACIRKNTMSVGLQCGSCKYLLLTRYTPSLRHGPRKDRQHLHPREPEETTTGVTCETA